jgi:hypothetical protein
MICSLKIGGREAFWVGLKTNHITVAGNKWTESKLFFRVSFLFFKRFQATILTLSYNDQKGNEEKTDLVISFACS